MVFLKNVCMPVLLKGNIIILEQLKRCICKIQVKGTSGTGFFCFIPYNNKFLPVLVTANHIINSEIDEITILMDDSIKRIQINEGRKTYFNSELNITIIEIIPEKDLIFDFLELDEKIFSDNSNYFYDDRSIYILHNNDKEKIISYGTLKGIRQNDILHCCNTDMFSGGAPILDIDTQKVIGIHIGSKKHMNYNFGTFLKFPITQFINLNKGYINSNGLSSSKFSLENVVCTVNHIQNINLNNIQNNGAERITELEEKIKELNDLLTDRINKANAIITKNTKTIDELKAKLSRFPFELLEGEKLMSIIITTNDKKIQRSIICKNTDAFCDIEKKIYKDNDKYFDIGNYFTLNGKKIDETKSLESNNIKDNDIIILNNLHI